MSPDAPMIRTLLVLILRFNFSDTFSIPFTIYADVREFPVVIFDSLVSKVFKLPSNTIEVKPPRAIMPALSLCATAIASFTFAILVLKYWGVSLSGSIKVSI